MNLRVNQGPSSFMAHDKLGMSSASRLRQSFKSKKIYDVESAIGDENNFGELEFMLENERKKFREAKEKF